MKICKNCGLEKVDPEGMPKYDVMNPEFNPSSDMSTVGPYCDDCWPNTYTGQLESSNNNG